jgi:hypothetical protein
MTIPTIKIHNVETGKVIERDMTAEEISKIEAYQAAEAARVVAEAEAKAAEEAVKQQAFNDAVAAAVAAALAAQQTPASTSEPTP